MKTINTSLILPLLAMFFSLSLSGCFAQFELVDNECAVAEIITIFLPPIIDPPPSYDPPCPHDPPPPAGHHPAVDRPQSPSPTRDSGYQRSGRSENRPSRSSGTEARPSVQRNTQPSGSAPEARPSGARRSGR